MSARVERWLADDPSRELRTRCYLAIAAAIVVIAAAWSLVLSPVYPVDDAYITLHNAKVLWAGVDPSYGSAGALAGATSLVHLALVAAFVPIAGDWAPWIVGWLAVLGFALGTARLGFAFALGPARALLVVAIALTAGEMPYQLLNGLETGLVLCGGVWLLALAVEERERALGGVAGLCAFVRPELAVLALLVLAYRAENLVRGRRFAALGRMVGAACLAAAPFAAWTLIATGALVPSTARAKWAFFAELVDDWDSRLQMTADGIALFASQQLLLLAAFVALARFGLGRIGLCFVALFYAIYAREFPGALSHNDARYQYVLVPVLVLGVAYALGRERARMRRVAQWLALGTLAIALVGARARISEYLDERAFTERERGGVATWCNAHLPAGSRLLIHDAGYLAEATRFPLVDFVGLKTPAAARLHLDHTIAAPHHDAAHEGRVDAVAELARETHPQFLVMLQTWESLFEIAHGLTRRGWTVVPVWSRSYAYTVYRLEPPTSPTSAGGPSSP